MTSSPHQPGQLEQDLADLKAFASNPGLSPSERRQAEAAAVQFEFAMRCDEWLSRCAKRNRMQDFWAEIPDDYIAILIADVQSGNGKTLLRQAANEAIASWASDNHCLADPDQFRSAYECTIGMLATSLGEEFGRRQQRNETESGARTKELIVEEARRAELLQALAERSATRLAVPQSVADRAFGAESREEARSVAVERIWEQVHQYTKTSPPAKSAEFLLAVMGGRFNKVTDHARDHIRTVVETELRRRQRLDEGDVPVAPGASETVAARAVSRLGPEANDNQILVEQILSGLTESDAKLLVEYCVEDTTQKELAALLGVSQGEVSKRLREVRCEVQRMLEK